MKGVSKILQKMPPSTLSCSYRYSSSLQETSTLLNDFTNFCYHGDLPRAMQALETMEKHGVYAYPVTYSNLIKCCLAHNAVREGKRLHHHVFSNGYAPKTILINRFINMYVKFNLLEEAQKLFDEMPERNVVSWNTMICAYSNATLIDRAMKLLVLMVREGVMPDTYTFSSVLRACETLYDVKQLHCSTVKVGLESDAFVRSALITVYSKLCELLEAISVFREMETGNNFVWNSIIAAFAQHSDGDEALYLYMSMRRAGFLADRSTLTIVLRACTSLLSLELGSQVHVHVLKFDQDDLNLNNALLDMYCKCGSLEDAKFIFNWMPEKDVITWSTMITGLAKNGFSMEALNLFESMKVRGPKPNHITILGVLFACRLAGLVDEGWYYFRSMKTLCGIDPGRKHYNCMLDLLGRAGKLDDMVRLIQEMNCEPNVVTWRTLLAACRTHRNVELAAYAAKEIQKLDPEDIGAYGLLSDIYANSKRWSDVAEVRKAMTIRGLRKERGCSWIEVNKISGTLSCSYRYSSSLQETSSLINDFTNFCYHGDLPRAMHALETMENHGVFAYAVTYSNLINCCLAHKAVREGKRLHHHVFSNGYAPKTFLINRFIDMYVKFNLLEEAQKLFDEMPERNVVSWNTMICAYSYGTLIDRAMKLLVLMVREGVMPDMYTFSSVLRACETLYDVKQLHCSTVKVGLESNVFVRSTLITVYSKLCELLEAISVFREMETGNNVVWNSIVAACAQHSDGDEALYLYMSMRRAGFLADQSTLVSVLRACTSLSLLELGRQVHVHVHVLKFDQDLILNNALLDMYCKCGSLEDAKFIFNWMPEKNVITWSTMINGLAQNGFSMEALNLFESMKVRGPKPDHITIIGVLFACSHAGLVDEGWYYFRSMKTLCGIDPGIKHYGCMLDLLGRAGKLDDMVKLIQEMNCEPDVVTWMTLLAACRAHQNVELAAYAAKEIQKLDPEDTAAYALLSDIYANSKRWSDVAEVRKAITIRGKEPGCSWIEVNKISGTQNPDRV